jgi:hypothetical protein
MMKQRGALPILLAIAVVAPGVALGQETTRDACPYKNWVGRAAEVEDLLENAEIVSVEDVGMGVTKPSRVDLKRGDVTLGGAYKNLKPGRHGGYWDSYQAEIAAYEIDKLLDLNMVPPTVERRVNKNLGSLQYWVEDCKLFRDVMDTTPHTVEWSHQLSRMKLFDILISNDDRNAQNFLVDPDHHVILIDHSRGFVTGKKILDDPTKLPQQFDRKVVEKMKALDKDTLESVLKPYLQGGQIKAILERRDAALKYIQKLIDQRGEDLVLF